VKALYIVNGNGLATALSGSVMRTGMVAKELGDTGFKISVLTTTGGKTALESVGLRARYYVVPASVGRREERSLLDRVLGYVISTVASLVVIWFVEKPDIVYTDSDYFCDIVPGELLRRLRGVLWIAMIHHLVGDGSTERGLLLRVKIMAQQLALRRIAGCADRAQVYATPAGDAIASTLVAYGMDRTRVVRVHNGFDANACLRALPAQERSDATLIGGLRPGKGLREIVPIWSAVTQHRRGALLRIVGGMTAEYRSWLEEEISRAGLSGCIRLEGAASHDRVLRLIKASRIVIAPSLQEGWGIAVCEALGCATPVVAYDLPTYRALFSGGWIGVPLGDRAAFAAAVVNLLGDERLLTELQSAALEAVKAYDWTVIAQREATGFEDLVNCRRPAAT
jgi:glycosyltransferase involved in cell wall biosynthesis